jgi:tetratricopeptide (TPR) repeat protein
VIDNKRGAFADAWPKMQTCLALQRQLDDPPHLAAALSMLGYVGAFLRKPEAVDYLRESLTLYQALNDLSGMASALVYLSTILVHQGLYAQAEENCRQSLHLSRQTADDSTRCLSLSNLCLVLVGQGGYEEILELSAEGLALDGGGQDLLCSLMGSRAYAQVKLGLDEALVQSSLQEALALAQKMRYPLAMFLPLCGLGELAWQRGEYETAWQCYRQALSAARTMGATFFVLGALLWLARLRTKMGEPMQALAWLALVLQHPVTTPTERQIAEQAWQQIADEMPSEEVAAAKAQGEALDLGQVVAELLEPQQAA